MSRHKNRVAHNKIDLTDKKIGKLKVLEDTGKRKSRRAIWLCECECGKRIEVCSKYLLCGDTKSCGCISIGNAHNRSGHGVVSGSYFGSIKRSAIARGIPFEITAEYICELFEKQNRKCSLTGEDIFIPLNFRDDYILQTASLDRLDSNVGYVQGNVHWVHKKINIMKHVSSVEEFIFWCKKVSEWNL